VSLHRPLGPLCCVTVITLALIFLPGCLSPAPRQATGTSSVASAKPAPTAKVSPPAPVWSVSNWTGFLRVGAAYEAPSHITETNAGTWALWSPSFHYEVGQAPQVLEVRLDWTAVMGQIQFMVMVPANGTMGEAILETPFADHGPLCARVPADRAVAGSYSVMAHSKVAVDAKLDFSVALLGGAGQLIDQPHSDPAAQVLPVLPSLVTGGTGESLAPEPCLD
jgi:hypothetical protein